MNKIVLPPCNRGRNKRGICAHKPAKSRTKRAKRQTPQGFTPSLHTAFGRREP